MPIQSPTSTLSPLVRGVRGGLRVALLSVLLLVGLSFGPVGCGDADLVIRGTRPLPPTPAPTPDDGEDDDDDA